MKRFQFLTAVILSLSLFLCCSSREEFKVVSQVTGGINTNCYLLYGIESKEAALFDVAGSIDTLLNLISEYDLNVRYIFLTHGHFDHVTGMPEIHGKFPNAKIIMHKLDYDDMFSQKEWVIENLGDEFINYLLGDPERKKIYDFDMKTFDEPDIFVEDGQIFELGYSTIKAIHSPGHSPGSVCYYIDGSLFSGDVLFYRTVGRVDVQNSSRDDQIKSVRRLYEVIPENTIVYPGHGRSSDIRTEKNENEKISVHEVNL